MEDFKMEKAGTVYTTEKEKEEAAGVVAIALEKALDKKTEKETKSILPPNIETDFSVDVISDEELEKSRQQAEEAKHLAETLGRQEVDVEAKLRHYKEKNPEWKMLSQAHPVRKTIEKLEGRLAQLANFSGSPGEHKNFAKFHEEIVQTDAANRGAMVEIFSRAVDKGHRIAPPEEPGEIKEVIEKARALNNGKLPIGTIFFERKPYFPPEIRDSRERAIESELRKKAEEYNGSLVTRIQDGCETDLSNLPNGKYGSYYLYSPRFVDKEKGWTRGEGHLKIEISDRNKGKKDREPFKIVEFKRGLGSLAWIAEKGYGWIPLRWLENGRMFVKNNAENPPSKEEIDLVNRKIRIIRAICIAWNKEHIEAKKTEEPKIKPEIKVEEKGREIPSHDETLKDVGKEEPKKEKKLKFKKGVSGKAKPEGKTPPKPKPEAKKK